VNGTEVVAVSGGVGGARLALGLQSVLPAGALTCLVNTGDDFSHLGLHISPDLDTVLYTLAGCNNEATGWGRRDETWTFMSVMEAIGGDTWFRLGDGDLALHVERTRRLERGERLTVIMRDIAARLGVPSVLLPMSDSPVRTVVHSDDGDLDFQDYFVRRRAEPVVRGLSFTGAGEATAVPELAEALSAPTLRVIVICPSNPWLSVDPVLAVPGIRELLQEAHAPVVAVCPLIGGRAVKGPTAKIMAELGLAADPAAISAHYRGLIDGLVIDEADAAWAGQCGVPTHVTRTLMDSSQARCSLARETLAFAARIAQPTSQSP
jgi:LPPG:FO 2-phospho-L-lactate transferase